MSTNSTAQLRHDLRTPLNHLIGYTEILLEEAELPELRTVLDHGKNILSLVNSFLAGSAEPTAEDIERLRGALTPHVRSVTSVTASVRPRIPAPLLPDLDRVNGALSQLETLLRVRSPRVQPPKAPGDVKQAPGKATLLVVDDDEENRRLLARRLSRDGHQVEVAESGTQGLEILRTKKVDLVMLDVMMPGMDGVEVLQRIKSDSQHRDIPVLMISALDELDRVVRSIELGAEDYLSKPFDAVLLRARVGACLEKKRLRDEERRYQLELQEWNQALEQRVQEQVAQLERLGRLKRFFSPQLAERIVAGGTEDPLRTHRSDITVVFLDLRGFTAFAETSEPEEIMAVLGEYHTEMGRSIQAHGGTLERFTGDGLMVFFNDPVPVPNPEQLAVRMAMDMRERVARLSSGWRRRGYDLGLGIGIARGYATLGAIGFDQRWDYAAIGTVTNLAARLCNHAAGGQIIVSAAVAAAAEPLVRLEPLGGLSLKGFARPVEAFAVQAAQA